MAAMDRINALLADVNASIEAYKKLDAFYTDDITAALDKYNQATYPDLYQALYALETEVGDALDYCTWTTAKIEETIAAFPELIKEGVQKAWDNAVASGAVLANDIDITVLFDQLAYTYSTTAQQGANVPDKEWKYGNASNFKTQYGTAEVWNQSPFTVNRTLADMPAGKYTITTKAFFRNADNEENYVNFDPANTPEASVFAGYSATGLANVAEIATDDAEAFANSSMVADGMYVPNNQQTAYNIFTDDAYTDILQKSVATVLTSAGDLTFGVKATEMESNSWVVWYSFSISYNAFSNADLYAHATDQYNTLVDLSALTTDNEAADGKNGKAVTAYETVDKASAEDLKLLVAQLDEAIAYANEYLSLRDELAEVYDLYNNYLVPDELVVSAEETYTGLLNEVGGALDDGFESNEQIEGFIAGIKDGFVPFVQYPFLATASEGNPGNITPVIYNYSFVDPYTQENNANGWTREFTGGKEDKSDEVYEFYNNEKFKISQTISGLAEGYYRIRVQAFYRGANNTKDLVDSLTNDPEYGKYVYLFGETETGNWGTAIKNIFQREDESGEIEFGTSVCDGESKVAYAGMDEFCVPGGRSSFHEYTSYAMYWNQVDVFVAAGEKLTLGLTKPDHYVTGDWCPFDNFELYYLGTTAPTGIEAIGGDVVNMAAKSDVIYNLAGQRVSKAVKGLYIINGTKVLVK